MDIPIAMVLIKVSIGDCIAIANSITSKWVVEGNIPSTEAIELWWNENAINIEHKLQIMVDDYIEQHILENIEDGTFERYE